MTDPDPTGQNHARFMAICAKETITFSWGLSTLREEHTFRCFPVTKPVISNLRQVIRAMIFLFILFSYNNISIILIKQKL